MYKFYQKNELLFSIILIVIYVFGASLLDELSISIGCQKSLTTAFLFVLSTLLIIWIYKNHLTKKYGLSKPIYPPKRFLFYIPLLLLVMLNLLFGMSSSLSFIESVFYIISMLFVGLVEELIFRGFVFKAMEKDNLKVAIIVSSVTFGFGHIINLFIGGFDNVLSNICQVCYATAVGFLFVIIFIKSKSLWPCILTHSLVNATSLFIDEKIYYGWVEVVVSIIIIFIAIAYSLFIIKTIPDQEDIKEISN